MSEMRPPDEPTGPPVYGEPAAGGPDATYTHAETLGTEPRKSRRGLVIGSAAAVLAVVAGAAVWATTTLSGGGRQPDEVVPKSTFAYIKVDLDPAANQKLAARSYFSKFPDLKDKVGSETDDVFDNLLAEVIKDEDLDYRTDVQPWFDKRAALAVFSDGGTTHVVGALRSKDDAKAKASLDKAVAEAKADGEEDMAYRLTKGYAILGDTKGVEAAVRLAETESLHDNEVYRNDLDRLDGDQVAVAWADVAKSFDAVTEGAGIAFVPQALASQAKGSVVAGLHLENDVAEVQGLIVGGDPKTFDRPGGQELLTGLPANTAAALSVNGFGTALGQATAGLPLDEMLGSFLEGSGVSVSGDLLPLLMKQTVAAVAPFAGFEDLQAGLVSQVDDPAKAQASAAKIQAALNVLGIPATAQVEGDRFVLAMPEQYGAELAKGGGGLGSTPRFTKAMGDLDGVTDALYLDVSQLAKAVPYVFGGAPEGMSFGAVSGARDGNGFFRLRLVVTG